MISVMLLAMEVVYSVVKIAILLHKICSDYALLLKSGSLLHFQHSSYSCRLEAVQHKRSIVLGNLFPAWLWSCQAQSNAPGIIRRRQ